VYAECIEVSLEVLIISFWQPNKSFNVSKNIKHRLLPYLSTLFSMWKPVRLKVWFLNFFYN